jgi:hypothetical protein
MKTTQEMPTQRSGRRPDGPTGSRHGKAPSRTIFFATVFAIVLATFAGGAVYVWQRERIQDREAALSLAIQQRDDARQAAEALSADARSDRAHIRALEAQVAGLQARVERLQNASAASSALVYRASDILSAVRAQVPIAEPMIWESVSIQACGLGYAYVLAHPGNIPAGTNVEDSEQVILKTESGEWTVITSGTGISPSEVLPPELQEALAA